jgi:hypothetical protein
MRPWAAARARRANRAAHSRCPRSIRCTPCRRGRGYRCSSRGAGCWAALSGGGVRPARRLRLPRSKVSAAGGRDPARTRPPRRVAATPPRLLRRGCRRASSRRRAPRAARIAGLSGGGPVRGVAAARIAHAYGVRLQDASLRAEAPAAAPAVDASPEGETCRRVFASLLGSAAPLAAVTGAPCTVPTRCRTSSCRSSTARWRSRDSPRGTRAARRDLDTPQLVGRVERGGRGLGRPLALPRAPFSCRVWMQHAPLRRRRMAFSCPGSRSRVEAAGARHDR